MVMKQRIKLTPELLVTAPRRSPAVPNAHGTHAVYSVSTYNLDSHSETKEIKILDIKSGESTLFTDDKEVHSPHWLVGTLVLWQKSKDGATELWIGNAVGEKRAYMAGKIDAAVDNLKTKVLDDGNIAMAFSAQLKADGTMFNAEKAEKPKSSAREYESIQVRYWDTYYTAEKSTLWYTTLEPQGLIYKLSTDFVDAFKGTGIEFPSLPTAALGEDGHYCIAVSGLVVEAADPEVNLAFDSRSTLYYVPLKTFKEKDVEVQQIEYKGFEGSASSPAVSLDGTLLAFKQQKGLHKPVACINLFITKLTGAKAPSEEVSMVELLIDGHPIDRDPGSLLWSKDNENLCMTVDDRGCTKLALLTPQRADSGALSAVVKPITANGSIASMHLANEVDDEPGVFITYSSLVDSSVYALIGSSKSSPDLSPSIRIVSDLSQNGTLLGLKGRSQISEFYAPGGEEGGYEVQSWVVKPSFFKEGEKYPLWFMIHGGPQGSWADAWSTRWNPAVWAEQGYVVVAPNPTGSTGWGFDYTESVNGDWGGRCYRDLVACYEYVAKNMPFVDLERCVAGGGSFGGYMANYIAGQPLGQKFKALVSHDGVFSMVNMISSDVPTYLGLEVGAPLWEDPKKFDEHAPSTYTAGWSVPMLIIHSDNDYRCPITEGLAAYNVCQMKGIASRFLNFPDENHFVVKRENSLQWYSSVLGWCNRYAKNEEGGNVKLKEALTRGPFKAPKKKEVMGKALGVPDLPPCW